MLNRIFLYPFKPFQGIPTYILTWFSHSEPYGHTSLLGTRASKDNPVCTNLTNKQTEEVQSSPGRLLTSRPLGADRRPPRAGNLHLPGQGTKEVSPSWTSEPPTAPSAWRAALEAALDDALYNALDFSLKLDEKIGMTTRSLPPSRPPPQTLPGTTTRLRPPSRTPPWTTKVCFRPPGPRLLPYPFYFNPDPPRNLLV